MLWIENEETKATLDLCVEDGVLFYGNDNSKPALILKSFDKSIFSYETTCNNKG